MPDLVLQRADLLPGDVLLFRPQQPNLIQHGIRAVTDSPYSHAAIYLGGGMIADSMVPLGVRKRRLGQAMHGSSCLAVLRSQAGFSDERKEKLKIFVKAVTGNRKWYDLFGALNFKNRRDDYFSNQIQFVRSNYNIAASLEDFSRQNFFCSAFVVACYAVVGIIDETAQCAYDPESFSPGHLGEEPTFGWLLGYLIPQGGALPGDDPLLSKATLWRNNAEARWW